MIPYAAYTTNSRSLAALRGAGWRVLLSPATGLKNYGLRHALDNGAWSAFMNKTEFDERAFQKAVAKIGANADFVVTPDIVEGGFDSLALSMRWLPWVLDRAPVALIAVQDGMGDNDIVPLLGDRVGVFVGGSTAWKEATMGRWGALCRQRGAVCHVGRVNSVRRISLCAAAGATSFDGSGPSRFAKVVPKLDLARRQSDLFAP